MTQLLLTADDLSKALKDKKQVNCILLDFAKAFDKVSHKKLITKRTDMTQVVVVDGVESEVAPVTSGVPQCMDL